MFEDAAQRGVCRLEFRSYGNRSAKQRLGFIKMPRLGFQHAQCMPGGGVLRLNLQRGGKPVARLRQVAPGVLSIGDRHAR